MSETTCEATTRTVRAVLHARRRAYASLMLTLLFALGIVITACHLWARQNVGLPMETSWLIGLFVSIAGCTPCMALLIRASINLRNR